jgi:hypothetical protein
VPALPAPLPPWAQALVKYGPIAYPIAEFLWDHISQTEDREGDTWRRVQFQFTRTTPTGTSEDRAMFKLDIVNYTGGQIDDTWNPADFAACETVLTAFWNNLKPWIANNFTLTEYRWYRMSFREVMTTTHRFAETGPPVRIMPVGTLGSSTATPLPYQNALSVTLKTPDRKHWGRFYIPGITTGILAAEDGRVEPTLPDNFADMTAQMINDLWESEYQIVVPITQHNKVLGGQLSTVKSVQVDDIVDVIRRRRPRQAKVKATGVYT